MRHVEKEPLGSCHYSQAAEEFSNVINYADEVKAMLLHPTKDFLQMIQEYNPEIAESENMYSKWIDVCCNYAGENGEHLRKWIEEKPEFTFSNHEKETTKDYKKN